MIGAASAKRCTPAGSGRGRVSGRSTRSGRVDNSRATPRELMMNVAQIEAELAQLDALIVRLGEPGHYGEAVQLRQARRRREMLQAELKRLARNHEAKPPR